MPKWTSAAPSHLRRRLAAAVSYWMARGLLLLLLMTRELVLLPQLTAALEVGELCFQVLDEAVVLGVASATAEAASGRRRAGGGPWRSLRGPRGAATRPTPGWRRRDSAATGRSRSRRMTRLLGCGGGVAIEGSAPRPI
ncbi:unnamed protein product [Musa acuminata subsp. burmannicoides]